MVKTIITPDNDELRLSYLFNKSFEGIISEDVMYRFYKIMTLVKLGKISSQLIANKTRIPIDRVKRIEEYYINEKNIDTGKVALYGEVEKEEDIGQIILDIYKIVKII